VGAAGSSSAMTASVRKLFLYRIMDIPDSLEEG
jgi:hypothetical protein